MTSTWGLGLCGRPWGAVLPPEWRGSGWFSCMWRQLSTDPRISPLASHSPPHPQITSNMDSQPPQPAFCQGLIRLTRAQWRSMLSSGLRITACRITVLKKVFSLRSCAGSKKLRITFLLRGSLLCFYLGPLGQTEGCTCPRRDPQNLLPRSSGMGTCPL